MNSEGNIRALAPRKTNGQASPITYADAERAYQQPASRAPSLWDYWWIPLRHKWVLLASVVVALALGVLISFATKPVYEAVGRVVINREGGDASILKDSNAGETDFDYMVAMDTQTHILQSDAIAKQVVRKLNLDSNPAFVGKDVVPVNSGPDPAPEASRYIEPHREAALVGQIRAGLQIESIPRTRMLEIRFRSTDANLAPKLVNTLIDTYIEQNYKTRLDAITRTSTWLGEQLSDLQMKVEESQEKLVRYQREHGILGIDDKQNIITSKLDELNKELTAAEADRIEKEALERMARSGDPDLVSNLDPASALTKLRSEAGDLRRQLAQASVRFDSKYPLVEELNKQLAAVNEDIKSEMNRLSGKYDHEYRAALERERLLRDALEHQKTEANKLNESAIEYSSLKREAEGNRELYESLLQKSKEAGVMTGLRSSNIQIVDPASASLTPVKPNIPHNIEISLLLGLVAGVSIAFVIESLDKAVHSSEQVQLATSLPLLAVIPSESRSNRVMISGIGSKLSVISKPRSEIAEAYRALRTAILFSRESPSSKVLVITSALPQEGKTTTSVNLSVVLAQQGARVLLIEGDMRRGRICALLNVPSDTGLSAILDQSKSIQAAIKAVPGVGNLYVLPPGPLVHYPSELLGSPEMKVLLANLRNEFDHIIIDTPPVLTVTDAVIAAAMADATLLVTRAGLTSKADLRRVCDMLAQVDARLIGVVLNAMDLTPLDHYYYGGYRTSNYYEYGPAKTAKSE
jgi:succinoglycan biosynthesis transport protein ExoP